MTLWSSAAALRAAFDGAFAAPPADAAPTCDLLAIRVASEPYALRLTEIAALARDLAMVPVPSPVPELRGIAARRGRLYPAYDLGALLGHGLNVDAPWAVLVEAAHPLAFCFEAMEGSVRLPAAAVASAAHGSIGGTATIGGCQRPIIHLASVIETLTRSAARTREER